MVFGIVIGVATLDVKWAAYWFSRVGAWLVRMLHRVIWVKHGLFLFVDDGLEFLPTAVAPLLALHSLMFLCGIGVPLSWGKLRFGQCLVWIGSQCRSARSARSDMLRALAPLRVWFEARRRELVADANSLQVCRKAFPRAHGAKRFGG